MSTSDSRHSRVGRVFIGPSSEDGPHAGYRGPITVDVLGVHLTGECEYLSEGLTYGEKYEWEPLFSVDVESMLVPWHRVHVIQWDGCGYEAPDDAVAA